MTERLRETHTETKIADIERDRHRERDREGDRERERERERKADRNRHACKEHIIAKKQD